MKKARRGARAGRRAPRALGEYRTAFLPPVAAALASFPGADANGLRAHAARLLGAAPDGRFLAVVAMLRRS